MVRVRAHSGLKMDLSLGLVGGFTGGVGRVGLDWFGVGRDFSGN